MWRPGFPHPSAIGWIAALCLAVWTADTARGALLPRLPAGQTEEEKRGRHVLKIATGCGCHGLDLAGWRAGGPDLLPYALPHGERFVGPFGVVPAANITPDPETGIGRWTDEQIVRAIREGIDPEGERLHPTMPYHAFHGMAESDMRALVAYLRRVPPVRNAVPPRELKGPVPTPPPLGAYPAEPPAEERAFGEYLVRHVSLCGDCHTPNDAAGASEPGRWLAGNVLQLAPGKSERIPNITPDRETGIGTWSRRDISRYLRTGSRPDGGLAQSLMAGLIVSSYSRFTPREANAIATYLKSLPPTPSHPR